MKREEERFKLANCGLPSPNPAASPQDFSFWSFLQLTVITVDGQCCFCIKRIKVQKPVVH